MGELLVLVYLHIYIDNCNVCPSYIYIKLTVLKQH